MTQPDKMAMATEIGRLEGEISKLESVRNEAERNVASTKTSRTVGAAGVLVGLILLIFFWPLGLLLIAAGGLALLTAIIKQSSADDAKKAADTQLAELRSKLAQLRAQIMI